MTTSSIDLSGSELDRAKKTLQDYYNSDQYATLSLRVGQWAQKEEARILETVPQALIAQPGKNRGIKEAISERYAAVKKDCKDLFRLHVGSVAQNAKARLTAGTKAEKIGTALALTGELWEGLSGFWHSLVEKHQILKPFDYLVVKPAAISLYAASLPEIAVVKSCEFIGKTSKYFGETGKIFQSAWKAAKDTSKSIVSHCLRLYSCSPPNAAMTAFYKSIGLPEETTKNIIELVTSKEQLKMLRSLTPGVASSAAKHITKALEGQTGINASDIVEPVLQALTKDSKNTSLNFSDFISHVKTNNPDLYSKLPATFNEQNNQFLSPKEIMDKVKDLPNTTGDIKKSLVKFVEDYTVGQVVAKVTSLAPTSTRRQSFADKYPSKRRASYKEQIQDSSAPKIKGRTSSF